MDKQVYNALSNLVDDVRANVNAAWGNVEHDRELLDYLHDNVPELSDLCIAVSKIEDKLND